MTKAKSEPLLAEREWGARSCENARRLLGQYALFRDLAAAERDRLITRARIRHYAPGQVIFTMGSAGDSMLAVLAGKVRISIPSTEGSELLLAILGRGEFFGDIAVLDGKERTADAQALTDCKLAILDRTDVLDFLQRQPNALSNLVEVLRLRQTDQHIAEVALLYLPARLAQALLRISQLERPTGQSMSQINLSQQKIANMIGAARESVNRCLHEWQRAGILRIESGFIRIVNRVALEGIVEHNPHCAAV
jgi:CRP-like cAMP-binding protein